MNKNIFNSLPLPKDLNNLKKELNLMHHQFDTINAPKVSKVRNLNQSKKNHVTNLKNLLDVALKEYRYNLELERNMVNSNIA